MRKEKTKLWSRMKHRYKIAIFQDDTYEEIFGARLSILHGLITLSVIAVLVTISTILLIAFTNLREFIPGYTDRNERHNIYQNLLRTDSLENELAKQKQLLASIQNIFDLPNNDKSATQDVKQLKDSIRNKAVYDTLTFNGISVTEERFRKDIEEEERFNLGFGLSQPENNFLHFFPPVDGILTRAFDEQTRHYAVDLVAKEDAKISSVLDGTVIFTDWTLKTGYVIAVQHKNDLVSIYKHNSVLLKRQGDFVRSGEAIALIGNTGEESSGPHLHFELWKAGNPLNPENFIKFK